MNLHFSFIIPVYNRPEALEALLRSLMQQEGDLSFEVVVVEDGSTESAEEMVSACKQELNLQYLKIPNQGAGKARNVGMQNARGNYFLVLDSDCLLPPGYLTCVNNRLKHRYTDAFGGPDAAREDFSKVQKAVSYAMTSFLTTGGIRGKKKALGKFQPRSFNMGISKRAFEETGGFSSLKIGEDIDLTLRLWEKGFQTQLIEEAYVYHKRRTTGVAFFKQTYAFGAARPVLSRVHPGSKSFVYWGPSLFVLGIFPAVCLCFFGVCFALELYQIYLVLILFHASLVQKSLSVGLLSTCAALIQLLGYGLGFLSTAFAGQTEPNRSL